eukprot:scaffold9406_cov149-Isochrysis_galbana.AAC.2
MGPGGAGAGTGRRAGGWPMEARGGVQHMTACAQLTGAIAPGLAGPWYQIRHPAGHRRPGLMGMLDSESGGACVQT